MEEYLYVLLFFGRGLIIKEDLDIIAEDDQECNDKAPRFVVRRIGVLEEHFYQEIEQIESDENMT